jgi:hypothetical protein
MRDLQDIALINGPHRNILSHHRAVDIEKARRHPDHIREQQIAHGKRVEARQAQNRADAPYPFCRTPAKCAGKGYCPADIACND